MSANFFVALISRECVKTHYRSVHCCGSGRGSDSESGSVLFRNLSFGESL